jgi:DNA (cytosine-5)-methyltransferase 1
MKKWAYYNDSDPFVCEWARELIKAGLVADGEVDCRPIQEVQPEDVKNFTQAHFFCGILGWSLALRLAGWGDDRPVWTGSCPCQPYSAAGKQKGQKDHRDLWPDFYRLIRECRPAVLFGEQVADAIRFGWLDRVCDDLEGIAYACGSAVLPACGLPTEAVEVQEMWETEGEADPHFESHHRSLGPPHIRHRLWWGAARLGFPDSDGWRGEWAADGWPAEAARAGSVVRLPDARGQRRERGESQQGSGREAGFGSEAVHHARNHHGPNVGLPDAGSGQLWDGGLREAGGASKEIPGEVRQQRLRLDAGAGGGALLHGMGVSDSERRQSDERWSGSGEESFASSASGPGFWSDFRFVQCRDGKARRVPTQSALFPLADGLPNRVGMLRGAGNAIVPEEAAAFVEEFIQAFCDVT